MENRDIVTLPMNDSNTFQSSVAFHVETIHLIDSTN